MDAESTKILNRLAVSVLDFQEARSYLDEWRALANDQLTLRQACVTAAIVAYGRPFLRNDGKEAASQLSPYLGHFELTERERTLHDTALWYRNKVVAHSDYEHRFARFHPPTDEGRIFMEFTPIALDNPDNLPPLEFRELVDKMFRIGTAWGIQETE